MTHQASAPGPIPNRTVEQVREAIHRYLEQHRDPLPLPGHGNTAERWVALEAACAEDADVGRLLEAHYDADAILAEIGGDRVQPGQVWAVWAAKPPHPVLRAIETDGQVVLHGTKSWCSGASLCTHALVTAEVDGQDRLFRVKLDHPGVTSSAGTWVWPGLAGCDTERVHFDHVPAQPVGQSRDYLERPGFWHGACGVAACWLGVGSRIVRPLADRARRPGADTMTLAALGTVDAALTAGRWALRQAATEIDADPDNTADARLRARRVRAIVEDSVTRMLTEVGQATGAGPLAMGAGHAQAVADATIYIRQSHGRKDLADLGAGSPLTTVNARSAEHGDLGMGTSEHRWQTWLAQRHRDHPPQELDIPAGPVLVVAPHPDDETLGCAGLLLALRQRPHRTDILVVADGAASHPDSPTLTPAELAQRRCDESRAAASTLGVADPDFLDLPDGALSANIVAIDSAITRKVTAMATGEHPVTLVAPWLGDGHPDHDAVATACRAVAQRLSLPLLEYPIWMWHHRSPADPEVPWDRMRALPLRAEDLETKRSAVACFTSQIAPLSDADADAAILPPHVIERLVRPTEWYFA